MAINPFDLAMEQIDLRPQQVVKIRLKTGIPQGDNQSVENVSHGAFYPALVGSIAWIGITDLRLIAIELEMARHLIRGAAGVFGFKIFNVRKVCHGCPFS